MYPYLHKGLIIHCLNQVWSTDITYIRLRHGWVYLVAIVDWNSRTVLSWRASNTYDRFFCIEALDEALWLYGKPNIVSKGQPLRDQILPRFLLDGEIKISMDGKGRILYNNITERL